MKPRRIFLEIQKYLDSSEAIIITGMRRTGKTTLLHLISEQIPSKNQITLDFENPINRKYFEAENYESIKAALEIQGLNFKERAFIFLDEIQFVKHIPSVVKYFIDHYQAKFFLTGSASFYLRNLFTESLAGRKYIFELFPLSFREFLVFKETSIRLPEEGSIPTKPVYDFIAPLYDEYLLYGGFPGVVLKESAEEKKKALDDLFSSYFQLEVLQLGDFRRNDTLRDFILLLAQRIGSKLDLTKISRELGVSRTTLTGYFAFLEGTYFIRTIRPFSLGKDTEIRKMPKVYFCDTGLANQLARLETGALFENSVFLNLSLQGEVAYYQKKSGVEIDFIVDKKNGYEVKVTPQPHDLKRLKGLCGELQIQNFALISKNYSQIDSVWPGFML